jgi:hypothetical protein
MGIKLGAYHVQYGFVLLYSFNIVSYIGLISLLVWPRPILYGWLCGNNHGLLIPGSFSPVAIGAPFLGEDLLRAPSSDRHTADWCD